MIHSICTCTIMYIHVVYLYPPPYFKVFSSYSPGLHSDTTFIVGYPRHSFPPHSLLLFPGWRGGEGRGGEGRGGEGRGRDGMGRDGTGRDGTGRDGTGREGRGGEGRGGGGRRGKGREGGATDNQLVTV